MKREDITKILGEDADKDKVTALLDAMHAEIDTHKDAAAEAQGLLTEKEKALDEAAKTANSAEELQSKLKELQDKYEADIKAAAEKVEALQFDGMIESAIRDAKGRNTKAIRALLDVETLKASKNQQADMEAAIKALSEAKDTAFLFGAPEAAPTGNVTQVGGKAGGTAEVNPWAKDTWNMAEQARIFRAEPEKAKALARSAGAQIY